jgi:hypothetical protein
MARDNFPLKVLGGTTIVLLLLVTAALYVLAGRSGETRPDGSPAPEPRPASAHSSANDSLAAQRVAAAPLERTPPALSRSRPEGGGASQARAQIASPPLGDSRSMGIRTARERTAPTRAAEADGADRAGGAEANLPFTTSGADPIAPAATEPADVAPTSEPTQPLPFPEGSLPMSADPPSMPALELTPATVTEPVIEFEPTQPDTVPGP